MMMAGLREAAIEELPALLERLDSYLPHSFTVHGMVKIRLRYDLDTGRRILVAPAPSSLVLITPTCAGMETQSLALFWDSEREDDRSVAKLLRSTIHVDWTKPMFFYAVAKPLLQKVEDMLKSGQLGDGRLVAQRDMASYLYSVTASRLPSTIRLPKEFRLGTIEEDHVEHLYKHWKYRAMESLESYRRMLRTLPGVGIFTTTASPATTTGDETVHGNAKQTVIGGKVLEDTRAMTINGKILEYTVDRTVTKDDAPTETLNTDGVETGWAENNLLPVAWTSLSHNNVFCNTFTLKKYRRRGLGRATTLALAACLLQEDDRASTLVSDDNEASIKFHEQLGFTRECTVRFLPYTVLKEPAT